jgi:leader peptidase (prepilin peptidase)/N-methyltransferase
MASLFEIVAAAVVGGLIGSFLNVVIWRLPRGESIVSPGSRCPACKREIAPYDNVPVVSWLVLRGRCRHCGARIPARYPLVELLTALAFAATVGILGFDAALVLELPFVACMIALGGIDLDHKLLPNRIVYPMALWGLAATLLVDRHDVVEHLVAGAGGFLFLFVALVAHPRGMGMGDVKLAGAMGLYLGLSVVPAMFIAFVTGSIVGLGIIAREGAQARKKAVPFGVFLAIGGLAGLLAGPELIELYDEHFLS